MVLSCYNWLRDFHACASLLPLLSQLPADFGPSSPGAWITGLLSNQGEKSINFYFIRVPLRKKVLKYGTPKPRLCKPSEASGPRAQLQNPEWQMAILSKRCIRRKWSQQPGAVCQTLGQKQLFGAWGCKKNKLVPRKLASETHPICHAINFK